MATKKTVSKKSATKTSITKKAVKTSDRKVRQIDAGWFMMYQDGLEVGQVVVLPATGGTTEYFFLYTSVTDPSQGTYTWPGPSNTPVTTTYSYKGTLPPDWSGPQKYQSNLYPIISQLVTADCTNSLFLTKKRASKKTASRAKK